MMFQHKGHEFHSVIGSDVIRDGMFLEVSETQAGPQILEVFYSDQTNTMTFTAFQSDIPFEIVEWAVLTARKNLTPMSKD